MITMVVPSTKRFRIAASVAGIRGREAIMGSFRSMATGSLTMKYVLGGRLTDTISASGLVIVSIHSIHPANDSRSVVVCRVNIYALKF